MTTIESLREKYGSEPVRLRTLSLECGGHQFELYLVRAFPSQELVSGNMLLDDGTPIQMNVNVNAEELLEIKRMHVQVMVDHLRFYTSYQHVSDYGEAQRTYEDEAARISKSHFKALRDAEKRIDRVRGERDELTRIAKSLDEKFVVDHNTERRLAKISRLETEVQKLESILTNPEPGKPDKSLKLALMKNSPIPLRLENLVAIGDAERERFLNLYGVVPVKPVDVQVEGVLRAKVVLRP